MRALVQTSDEILISLLHDGPSEAGSALARRQRHNAFLFSWTDMSNDGCDSDMFLYISWEFNCTGPFPSQVGYCYTGTSVPMWTVSSRRIGSRDVCKQMANMNKTDLPWKETRRNCKTDYQYHVTDNTKHIWLFFIIMNYM